MSRTVLITGCSTGIGRALAGEFHARGCTVVATARRLATLDDLAAKGIRTAELDVNDAASIDALLARLREEQLFIDLLVNNAGYGAMGPLVELPLAEARRQFETNVIAVLALIQAVAPEMMRRRQGRIVNIGSVSGILVTPFSGAYCATKAAVHALSDALRLELAPFNVDVITVQPGGIRSQFGATASQGITERGSLPSAYRAIADAIAARAKASQDRRSTSAEDFARDMVRAVLADRPPPVIRIGHGSRAMPAVQRWIPARVLDSVLRRRFRLDQRL